MLSCQKNLWHIGLYILLIVECYFFTTWAIDYSQPLIFYHYVKRERKFRNRHKNIPEITILSRYWLIFEGKVLERYITLTTPIALHKLCLPYSNIWWQVAYGMSEILPKCQLVLENLGSSSTSKNQISCNMTLIVNVGWK